MRINKKIIIAAALAVCLSGCAANSEGSGAPLSSPSTSTSTYSPSSEEVSDTLQSESAASTSAASTSAASESKASEAPETESEDDYVSVGWLTAPKGYKPPKSSVSETKKFETLMEIKTEPDPDCDHFKKQRVYITEPTEDDIGQYGLQCVNCGYTITAEYAIYFDTKGYRSVEDAEKAQGKYKANKAADNLIDKLGLNSGEKSDIEKLCILNKWFCDNTAYDATLERHAAYDILVEGLGVCSSYAEALCIILPKCGIETYWCSSEKLNHAWNAVKIDGQWTYTDFTGGIDHNSEKVILGSSCHGVPDYIQVKKYYTDLHEYKFVTEFDFSAVSTKLRLFDLNGNELEVHEEAGGFWYVDSNGKEWECIF